MRIVAYVVRISEAIMAARSKAVAIIQTSTLPQNVLTRPCENVQRTFQAYVDFEISSRREREEKTRAAVAGAYKFAEIAFANPTEFDALRTSLGVSSRAKTSNYGDVVKTVFGVWEIEQENGQTSTTWKPISDSHVHKYAKVMDYARFKRVAVNDIEEWLNKEGSEPRSLSKRYIEANKDAEYEKDRVSRGLLPKQQPVEAIILTDEQLAMIAPRLVDQRDLEQAPETDDVQLVLRQVHSSGHVEYYALPAEPHEAQAFLNSILKIDTGDKPFKRLFDLLKLASLVRTAKDEKGPVIRIHMGDETKATIAHNGLRGSVRIDVEHNTPDDAIPTLDTYLDKKAIDYINELWTNFKGDWVFDPPHFIIVTPPNGMTVSARVTQINEVRKQAAEEAKRADPTKGSWTPFSLPNQFEVRGDKAVVVPLSGWISQEEVRFTEPQRNVTYLQHKIILDDALIEKIVDKERQVLDEKVPSTKKGAKPGDQEPRIKGSIYNFRVTNSRIAFCDIDGNKLGTVDIPRIGEEGFRKEMFLFKRDLSKVLRTLQSIFRDIPVLWEMSDNFFRFSVEGGTARVSVILPAVAPSKQYNSTAFSFEPKPETAPEPVAA